MPLAHTTSLSGGALVAVIVVGLIELGLMVYCLVDLVRRPQVAGGRQWVWAVVIVLFGFIGPIVYLAVGREPAPVKEPPPAPEAAGRVAAAADLLYGPPAPPPPGAPAAPGESQPPAPGSPPGEREAE